MKIVVDTNIVFSAILNTQSRIGQILINGSEYFDYYSVGLLKLEILKHKLKILKFTGYTDLYFNDIFDVINKSAFWAASGSFIDSIFRYHITVPGRALLGDAFPGSKINAYDPKARLITLGPLKIIE